MIFKKLPYWIPVEESEDSTTFEGSLQSKMSRIILNKGIKDILIANRRINYFNLMKGASVILRTQLMKEVVDNADAFENPNISYQ
jgi:hypothetical protein